MKNVRKIIAVLVVLCVLVTAQICTLAEYANAGISGKSAAISQEEGTLVSNLKTAWSEMYKKTAIANFDSNSKLIAQHEETEVTLSDWNITLNSDGTFTRTKKAITYLRGLVFNKDVNGTNKLFTRNINSADNNSFNNAFNNDSLYFTFNPGTVNAEGNILVMLQYAGYGGTYVLYSEVPVSTGDANTDKVICVENLAFKSADGGNYPDTYSFEKLSDILVSPINQSALFTIKIMFDANIAIENAKISSFEGKKFVELPDGIDSLSTVELYNQAVAAEIDGYENTEDFVAARTALYDYLCANNQDFIVSELKDAWSEMCEKTDIANFDSNSKLISQHDETAVALSDWNITLNSNGTFTRTSKSLTYLRGLVFNKDVNGTNKLFTSNINSTDNNSFNNAFNNDSLYFTFNPGTVNAEGNILVMLQYAGYGGTYVLYSEVPVSTEDAKTDKVICVEDLVFKSADSGNYPDTYSFEKLSDILVSPINQSALFTIKIMFDANIAIENAKISSFEGKKFVELPDGIDSLSTVELYNQAVAAEIDGYENTEDFVEARTALYNYLRENNQDFIVAELKDSWSKLSKDETVAAFDSNSKIMNQNDAVSSFQEPSSMGITFNNDGTFDKAQHSNDFGGDYQLYGMTFNVNVDEENKPFTSNIDSFNNAFSNDSLYFTFNPGTVTKGAEIWVLLQYNGTGYDNVLRSVIKITPADSGKDIKVDIKDLTYNCRNVSGYDNTKFALKNPVNGLNTDLCAIKIFFHHDLAFTGASISGLKYTNSETVPADTDSEIVIRKALRVDDAYYGQIAYTFVERRTHLYNIIKGERKLGDVNGVGGVDICDLVSLYSVVSADGYDRQNQYELLSDMDANGYVEDTDISELRKTLLNMD